MLFAFALKDSEGDDCLLLESLSIVGSERAPSPVVTGINDILL